MSKLVSITISVIIFLAFSFCSASKNKIKSANQGTHPFKITKAIYNTWVGGQPGVKGINFTITIDNPEVTLDSLFYNNKIMELKRDFSTSTNTFVATFVFHNKKQDFILDKDSVNEYGNTPQHNILNIPFKLKKNEAAVSYFYKKEIHYYKVIISRSLTTQL